MGLSIVNGWLLYKRHALQHHTEKKDIMSLLDFHSLVALSLLQENKSISKEDVPDLIIHHMFRKNLTFIPPNEIRYDNVCHLPEFANAQHRCRYCPKGYTRIKCYKCDVFMCTVTGSHSLFRLSYEGKQLNGKSVLP